jgi:peroxiredoxin
MKMKTILTLVTSFVTTAVFAVDPPPVGNAAPDFSLSDTKGETHSLSQYKGKYVVLEWFNPVCPFVKNIMGVATCKNCNRNAPIKESFG